MDSEEKELIQNTEMTTKEKDNRGWNQSVRKLHNIAICVLFVGIIAGISIISIVKKDTEFSENENRYLTKRPDFSLDTLLNGEFIANYEKYVTDQFFMRDEWIGLKVMTERVLWKKDVNGVYFGKGNYLIQQHKETDVDAKQAETNLVRLQEFVKKYEDSKNIQVMIVPTASEILTDKLPAHANGYDQQKLLDRTKELVGLDHFIDVKNPLLNHGEEYIFYRTDHHWTSLGAYYAYLTWAKQVGITAYQKEDFEVEEVTKEFYGTLHSKVNIKTVPDSISLYQWKAKPQYKVTLNRQKEMSGLFDYDMLKKKDKYSIFLGGNNAYVSIKTGIKGRKLLIIKDSFAHTFAPFVANHYEETILIDYRYYNDSTEALIQSEGITDILVLYNTINLVQDTNTLKFLK